MDKGTKEDLEIDRRDTCTEQCIVHTGGNFKPVNTDSKSHEVKHRTEFLVMAVILVGMVIGLFYFVHQLNIEMQRQFGEMQVQFGEIKQQLSALRSDVADNRRLIEANSTQLESLRSEVGETSKRIDEVNDCLDSDDECLAVVDNVLSIDHQTSAYYKPGKL